jgi:hypothetical protein
MTNPMVSPSRNGSFVTQQQQQQQQQQHQHQHQHQQQIGHDPRSNLPRRFTTDSGHVPTLATMTMTSPPRGPEVSQEYNVSNSSWDIWHRATCSRTALRHFVGPALTPLTLQALHKVQLVRSR